MTQTLLHNAPDTNGKFSERSSRRKLPYVSKLLLLLAAFFVVGLIVYDLFPDLVLRSKVNQFLDVVQVGDHREAVDSELKALGFKVPAPGAGAGGTALYPIRLREPVLARVADAIAFSMHKELWWSDQKRPHYATVQYDEHNVVTTIALGSYTNPLWH